MEPLKVKDISLEGVVNAEQYKEGSMRSCRLNVRNVIQTPYGELIPAYEVIDARTKYRPSISYFETGEIKSIYLQGRQSIITPLGEIEAELITFYKEGSIHRIFPLYGQISGYWPEEEEYNLAVETTFQVGETVISGKVSCYCFYPSGNVKTLSFWAEETINIKTPSGPIVGRLGIAFYENGQLKSIEPQRPTLVATPIGEMMAYDNAPIGVHGDLNSLVFNQEGQLISLKTIQTMIYIRSKANHTMIIRPRIERDPLDLDNWRKCPLTVHFNEAFIEVNDGSTQGIRQFKREEYTFKTYSPREEVGELGCQTCEGCTKCHQA